MTLINETYNEGLDILVVVWRGVISDIVIPKQLDVRVIVHDYDVEGCEQEENLEIDEDGDRHHTGVWENDNKPIADGMKMEEP